MQRANRGPERYSAWFADRAGEELYFGLSPFWELLADGGPSADLREPGDPLIGRFHLEREEFLPPLRVRALGPRTRSSVWDVLAHSSGRICFTTFDEEAGCVDPQSGHVTWFASDLGPGLNELAEGPGVASIQRATPVRPQQQTPQIRPKDRGLAKRPAHGRVACSCWSPMVRARSSSPTEG